MEFTFKGGMEIRPNGYASMKAIFDTLKLEDLLDQFKDRDIFECLDADSVADYFGLVKPE